MRIEVAVPGLLRDLIGGEATFVVDADTLAEAVAQIRETQPRLRPHVFDEAGRVRQHVVIFLNDENVKDLDARETRFAPGDRLHILQAVSGGLYQWPSIS